MDMQDRKTSSKPQYLTRPEVMMYVETYKETVRKFRTCKEIENTTRKTIREENCEKKAMEMMTEANEIIDRNLRNTVEPGDEKKQPYAMMEIALEIRDGRYIERFNANKSSSRTHKELETIDLVIRQEPSYEDLWDRIEREHPDISRVDQDSSTVANELKSQKLQTIEGDARNSLIRDLGPFEGPFAMRLITHEIRFEKSGIKTFSAPVADGDFIGQIVDFDRDGILTDYTNEEQRKVFEHHNICMKPDGSLVSIPKHTEFKKIENTRREDLSFYRMANGQFRIQNIGEPEPDRINDRPGVSEMAEGTDRGANREETYRR